MSTPSERVIARSRELRLMRGWSASRLSTELARSDFHMSRNTIANLESARKNSVSVDEWHALAIALNVPPEWLLLEELPPLELALVPATPQETP